MDFRLDPNHIFPEYPTHEPPVPREILSEPSSTTYLVAWHSNEAGIVHPDPKAINKDVLAEDFPDIVSAWETKQRRERHKAHTIEQRFLAFAATSLYPRTEPGPLTEEIESDEVECDQSLQAGMGEHWGEVRRCEKHPSYRPDTWICKGCRVAQFALDSSKFVGPLIMARGARVPVCAECAEDAVKAYMMKDEKGMQYRECVCDTLWTCFRCREEELGRLWKVREERYQDEVGCGTCEVAMGWERHVDFCLSCRRWRVYAATSVEFDEDGGE